MAVPLIVAETVLVSITVDRRVTVTVAVCVLAVPLAVADTVFASATVELKVPVATPLAFVGPLGCVSVLPLPVAASTTVAPLTGFPFASFAVTVIVVPLAVAQTVFASATVELRVPAATPLALVGPLAWVSVLPLPVAASTTVAPLMGFPLASLPVT